MPFLSVIIPARNEERRLPGTLDQVLAFLKSQPYSSEILVVENGSHDRTFEIAQEYASRCDFLQVLHSESGKGSAVRCGMLAAKGEYRFMCDADLSMPIAEINNFIPPKLTDFDIAIGSREAPGAVRYNEPLYRHLGGRVVNIIVRLLALPGLNDSQCGFKCFPAPIVEDLFHRQTLSGWSFDIELLYIARLRGYRMVEVPIHWYFNADSKLNAVRDALRMISDILLIHRKAHQGLYDR